MRIFEEYTFNITDKVKRKDVLTYIQNMIAELGLSWSDLAFRAACTPSSSAITNILEKFPELKKYFHNSQFEYGMGICSHTENWCSGELFADKSDYDNIFTVFSKIPRPFNVSGRILLSGVNWFGEKSAPPAIDYRYEEPPEFFTSKSAQYCSNYIEYAYHYGKDIIIHACIEVTDEPVPHESSIVIEKLIPYLGEPVNLRTVCIFSREENKRLKELKKKHSEYLNSLIKETMPVPKYYPFTGKYKAPIPHIADIPVMKKAFAGTGFTHKKGNPGWLGEYDFRDSHGFTYQAHIQKGSDGYSFTVSLHIFGCNFRFHALGDLTYEMEKEGESQPILREFALLCAKIRDEYGDKLAEDFGDTPDWYYKVLQK